MATSDETNTSELPAFSRIKAFEQRAVVLKAEGQTVDVITNQVNAEFNLSYKPISVREWFYAGGRLEAAFHEYNDKLAEIAIKEARQEIKKSTKLAADTIIELMGEDFDAKVRLGAGKTILAKYIPDKQVVLGPEDDSDDLPGALGDQGDEVVTGGGEDGQKPVDEPPKGEKSDQSPGPSGG